MFGIIISCLLGIIAIVGAVWFVVCAFMESEYTANIVAAIIALMVAFFFFTLADMCYKEYTDTNTAQTAVVATEYEREV